MRPIHRPDRAAALAVLCVLVSSAQGWAQDTLGDTPTNPPVQRQVEGSSQEGALFLLLPQGAQGVAMGRAMTALRTPEAAFWNPAGLNAVGDSRILFYRGDNVAGEAVAFSALFVGESLGTVGLSYQLLDVGDQELTDDQGNILGRVSVRNHLAVVSFATELVPRLETGLNLKMIQFRVGCSGRCQDQGVTATTYAIDAGVQSRPFERIPLRLGAMVAHLGPKLQVVNAEQADPLPTRIRVSGAYEMLGHFVSAETSLYDLWVTVELEDRWRDPGSPSMYLGTEFSAGRSDALFVRAGYVLGNETERDDGAAVGVGLRFERFDLGVAKALSQTNLAGEEPVHITFGVIF